MAGVVGALIGAYNIDDCLRYRSGPGQCDQKIQDNVPLLVVSLAAVVGPIAGYFTLNTALRRPEDDAPTG
jgi:hypothetical protein